MGRHQRQWEIQQNFRAVFLHSPAAPQEGGHRAGDREGLEKEEKTGSAIYIPAPKIQYINNIFFIFLFLNLPTAGLPEVRPLDPAAMRQPLGPGYTAGWWV